MGGGDLNLKKSWHPNTLKNQKRVYEAEQADAAERRKLHELQREIEHERNFEELKRIGQNSGVLATDDSKRLEWMYKGSENSLNREEYLTGRSVDKHFEDQEKIERQKDLVGVTVPKNHVEHECIPFSIRAYSGAPTSEDQVDLQRKIMEDPLMMIQQREMERRQKLLQNPVKLKEIHRLLQQDKKIKEDSSNKKKKKSKKKRSHSDDSEDDLDSQLAKKYKQLLGDKDDKSGSMNIDKLLNEKYEKLSSELDKIKKSKKKDKKKKSKKRKDGGSSDSDSSDSDDDESKRRAAKGRERPDESRNRPFHRPPDRRFRNNSPQWNRFNRRSPIRNDRFGNNFRYNNKTRPDRFDDRRNRDVRRRSNSPRNLNRDRRSPPARFNDRDRYARQRSRSPVREKRNIHPRRSQSASPDRYKNRRQDRDNSRNRSNRANERNRSKSRSISQKRNQKRHSRSRSRSLSNDRRSKNSRPTLSQRSASKSPKKSFRNKSPKDEKHETERAIRGPALPPNHSKKSDRSSSSSSGSSSDSDSGSDHKREPPKNFGLVTAGGEKIKLDRNNQDKYKPVAVQKKVTATYVPPQPRKKLTEEEKDERLREMEQNAKWHEKEQHFSRRRNEERAKQESDEEKTREFDRNYIHKEMHKALNNQDTVEARLKSNKNNIQRMSSSMHSHFAKK